MGNIVEKLCCDEDSNYTDPSPYYSSIGYNETCFNNHVTCECNKYHFFRADDETEREELR